MDDDGVEIGKRSDQGACRKARRRDDDRSVGSRRTGPRFLQFRPDDRHRLRAGRLKCLTTPTDYPSTTGRSAR